MILGNSYQYSKTFVIIADLFAHITCPFIYITIKSIYQYHWKTVIFPYR